MDSPVRRIAKFWFQQLLLVGVVSVIFWYHKPGSHYSVLLAWFVYWLPNGYFTLCAFRHREFESSHLMVRNLYQGEIGKFLLTAIGFALVFILVPDFDVFALFAVYFGLTISQWFLVTGCSW